MAIRKATEDTFVVEGARDTWLPKVEHALETQGFTGVEVSSALYQVQANYRKATVWGKLALTLTPDGEDRTTIKATATANVDNVFALFSSPGRRIIGQFKQGLT